MLKITYNSDPTSHSTQQRIQTYIREQRQQGPFRVIDCGGWLHGWTENYRDLLVDINADPSRRDHVQGDLNQDATWERILEITREQGLFDYAVCTHTLEDLANPEAALRYLPRIARAGVITMPSVYHELGYNESTNYPGAIHHRWVFDQTEDGRMLIVPKLPALTYLIPKNWTDDADRIEIEYQWSNQIEYTQFMGGFLGPTIGDVINSYTEFVKGRL